MTKDSTKRILAVDDNPDITLMVKTGLEASGIVQVDTFNDPELALSIFRPDVYDLALLDLRMPKMYRHELYIVRVRTSSVVTEYFRCSN